MQKHAAVLLTRYVEIDDQMQKHTNFHPGRTVERARFSSFFCLRDRDCSIELDCFLDVFCIESGSAPRPFGCILGFFCLNGLEYLMVTDLRLGCISSGGCKEGTGLGCDGGVMADAEAFSLSRSLLLSGGDSRGTALEEAVFKIVMS